MIFTNLILAAILALLVDAVVFGLALSIYTYLGYRGPRVVTCPENLTGRCCPRECL